MEKESKFSSPQNELLHVSYYILGVLLIIIAHKIDPTNLAGPGLDRLSVLINFIGTTALVAMLIMPARS
jgi:hypothetical protein